LGRGHRGNLSGRSYVRQTDSVLQVDWSGRHQAEDRQLSGTTLSWKSPMPEGSYLYCDVSLPVPLDQPFTYSLPDTLRHRVRVGSRLIVPFGTRKLTGVILPCHDDPPEVNTRDALRLIDSEPVLS